MTTLAPYNWLRKIPADLKKIDETPLLGNTPLFNWTLFEQELAKGLDLEEVSFKATPLQSSEPEKLQVGYEKASIKYFRVSPLNNHVSLLIPEEDLTRWFQFLAQKELHHHIIDKEFEEAFHKFVLLETFHACQKAFTDHGLTPQLLEEGSLPTDLAWYTDISFSWKGGSLACRLIIPNELRQSFKERYKESPINGSMTLFSNIMLSVHIEAGRTRLSREEWKNVQNGDYVILDSCQLVPGSDKARVLLTVNQTPVFRAKIKDGSIKILETPYFNDLGNAMPIPPKDAEDLDTDEEFDDLDDDEDEDDDLDDDLEDDDDDDDEDDEDEAPVSKKALPPLPSLKPKNENASLETNQKPFNANEIPLDIVVEVGHFQMTVQKLSELQPGNLIDLDIHPENGVDLVVNGTCIAKGELLKIGDTLGVRILDIAK